jgi:hybrid cluster-associated redox disulfide protein
MIHKTMSVKEVVTRYPMTLAVFRQHGMGCAGCGAALFESIEEGAQVHGIDADALIKDLNQIIKSQ